MYGVILMAAMSAGGEVPAFHHRRGCYGCSGCHGCYGGCYGCSGGWGGCHGCYGGYTYAGAGYYGYGCWGYGCNGCSGYYGCYGAWTCYGGYYCTGTPQVFSMVPVAPNGPGIGMPEAPSNGDKNTDKNPEKGGKNDKGTEEKKGDGLLQISLTPDRAKLIVTLPADAKLFVDNQPMQTPSETRVFQSPRLEPGQMYYYTLRAEVVRDGRTITRAQRVVVQGGRVTRAAFADLPGEPSGPVLTVQR